MPPAIRKHPAIATAMRLIWRPRRTWLTGGGDAGGDSGGLETIGHLATMPQTGMAVKVIHRSARQHNDRHNPIYEWGRIPNDEALRRERSLKHWYAATATQVARRIVSIAAKRVDVRFEFADGTAGDHLEGRLRSSIVANPDDFYRRLGTDAKMAFGEAYVAGDWTAGHETDLADLLTPFAAKLADLVPAPLRKMRAVIDRKLPRHTKNTRDGAKTNIEAHYDMSNDLFAAFLDETMTYSSAWFADLANESLERAQLRKLDGILDYAEVGKGTRVLEIGSGWGSLAIRAAERGAHVTSITLVARTGRARHPANQGAPAR